MRKIRIGFLAGAMLALSSFVCAQNAPSPVFDGQSWWNYVKVLAADDMEGRDTGSRGLEKASAYVVDQLKKDGLQPAGENGYYQQVKLVSRQIDESGSSLALTRDGKSEPLVLGDDAMFSTRVDLAPEVEAPLVFVGYGLRVPEKNYNDFEGLDVKGKVVVIIPGSPSDMPGPLASHYQSLAERAKTLRDVGAIGGVIIPNPASMDIPWSRMRLSRTMPSMSLADPALDDSRGIKLTVTFNPADADKLFQDSGHTFAELAALAKERKPLPHFPLKVGIQAKAKMNVKQVTSANIIAKQEGSDPKLKNEYVVLSAHLDHIGIGQPINGDSIYNGAMDNASGSALVLDVADEMHRSHVQLKRSVLFVIVTAEEKGLLGSRYFAARPTVPRNSMVADINTDMFLPIIPLKVITVFGLAESTLGDDAQQVAAQDGIEVQPDPQPLRNIFIRSDQYSFIKEGVPSLMMMVGAKPGSPEEKVENEWLTHRYHAPSDDINQPVDIAAAGKFEAIVEQLAVKVADTPERPQWKSDSFFRRFAQNETSTGQ